MATARRPPARGRWLTDEAKAPRDESLQIENQSMSDPRKLGELRGWGGGGVIAMIIAIATASVPLVVSLLGRKHERWEAVPCVSGLLLLLVMLIEQLARRWSQGANKPIPGTVAAAAQERFRAPEGKDRAVDDRMTKLDGDRLRTVIG